MEDRSTVELSAARALDSIGRYATETCRDLNPRDQVGLSRQKLFARVDSSQPEMIKAIICAKCVGNEH